MKKFLLALTTILSVSTMACWFTESNFNATYIASINSKAVHYNPVQTMSSAVYKNGQSVDLPLTVQIKVSPRFGDQDNETPGEKQIIKAILQYKIERANGTSTKFKTVKTIDNPNWKMDFSNPVNLFGKSGIIDIPKNSISAGDVIIIRLYLTDGMFHTGDLNSDIKGSDIKSTHNANNISIGTSGWSAPHVFKVVFSGKRRVMI